ncbi:histidine--tRNA ligase [Ahrensia marina]|uniref:Histidine--tRNA ligase n=1 Tax=Ahrensia marina TaxID=1514904 RepID=A0A0M9GP64_9HYPH|nr:histidine--tRNA ligase [Ahrensia marina]KPB02547.1 histidyl-tRNA synthase [Ahrensia marina]
MADKKKKKPQKLKARSPRGFVDRSAADIRATDEMIGKIREVYERYGFDPVETPAFEYTDCLGKFLPDTDRPNAGVFSVQDDDEQWMSLRYDLTAPLARHVAENINEITLPYRTYRNGWVFRNEKPGPGRFRQFMQFDADTVGAPGVQADAEMCMMMADTMEALGIKRGDYVIRVNNRKVLDAIMASVQVAEDDGGEQRLAVLRALDKFDKFGLEGVVQLLGTKGRMDESGDHTKGAGLNDAQIMRIVNATGWNEVSSGSNSGVSDGLTLANLEKALSLDGASIEGVKELEAIRGIVRAAGYEQDRIWFDPSVVRGLEYYTGPVYEAELLFDVTNEKGEKVQFGSVGGGGRYDGLVKRFTGQDVPATGFSIGVSRLMTALKNLGKLGQDEVLAPVLVTVMDKDTESLGAYQKMVQDLRGAGIRAEMYQGNPKDFSKQMRYADKRGCPIVIIQGNEERENSKVQLKDMIEGKRQAAAIESNEEYRAARPGQFEIDAADLVDEVKKLLAVQASA